MDSSYLYQKARKLQYQEHDYDKALKIYLEIVEKFPHERESGYAYAEIDRITNMSEDEIDKVKKIVETEKMRMEEERIKTEIQNVIVTTTHSLAGYSITKYIDVESVEYIIGTGIISEFTTGVQDFFGERSSAYEKKLAKAKKEAIDMLKYKAVKLNGNAIIGINMNFAGFSSDRVGLIISGTIVRVETE